MLETVRAGVGVGVVHSLTVTVIVVAVGVNYCSCSDGLDKNPLSIFFPGSTYPLFLLGGSELFRCPYWYGRARCGYLGLSIHASVTQQDTARVNMIQQNSANTSYQNNLRARMPELDTFLTSTFPNPTRSDLLYTTRV